MRICNAMEDCRPPFGAPSFLSFFAAHLPAGRLFESQVLPPGWLLWNQLSGIDGRMRKRHQVGGYAEDSESVMEGALAAGRQGRCLGREERGDIFGRGFLSWWGEAKREGRTFFVAAGRKLEWGAFHASLRDIFRGVFFHEASEREYWFKES